MNRDIRTPEKINFPLENLDGDNFEDSKGEVICLSEILNRLDYLETLYKEQLH